ncbi:MAG: HEAT repeat domain-containing protein [Spirochaetota bacterium]|nr:HEAT repeat domain-containing protein [Spirochaetota bacterium]
MYKISCNTVIHADQTGSKSIHKRMELRGTLNFRIFQIMSNSIMAGFQFSPVHLRHSGKENVNAEKLFSKLFFAEISSEGEFIHFDFSNEIAQEDEKSIKDVITSFQFIVRDSLFARWNAEEEDGNGEYMARYSKIKGGIEKSKSKYIDLFSESGAALGNEKTEIKKSNLKIEYGRPESWIKNAKGNELIIFYSDENPFLKVSSTVNLELIPFSPKKNLAIWDNSIDYNSKIADWESLPKNSISLARKNEIGRLNQKFAGKNFFKTADDLFEQYRSFDVQCIETLLEFLSLHPEAALKFPTYLLEKNLNPTQRVMLVHALERDGREQAQKALTVIMEGDEFQTESRIQAAIAFGSIENPTDGAVNSLWDVYDDRNSGKKNADKIASTAVLSLGAMTKNLNNSSSIHYKEKSREIKKLIASELQSDHDINTKAALLHSAGNTADKELIEDICTYFNDKNPRVRSAAVTSLIYMEDNEVNERLSKELFREENANVRNAIVVTMHRKEATEGSVESILEELPSEENDIVRGQMYRYLLKNRNFPGVKDALRRMLINETSHEHRKLIHTALSTRKKSNDS